MCVYTQFLVIFFLRLCIPWSKAGVRVSEMEKGTVKEEIYVCPECDVMYPLPFISQNSLDVLFSLLSNENDDKSK